jgi:hypothetical protein
MTELGLLLSFLAAVLLLGSQDAAPFLVLGDGHPAFDANPNTNPRLGLSGEELLQ